MIDQFQKNNDKLNIFINRRALERYFWNIKFCEKVGDLRMCT